MNQHDDEVRKAVGAFISTHWSTYNHSTMSMIGYQTALMSDEDENDNNYLNPPSLKDIQGALLKMVDKPDAFAPHINGWAAWDETGGDCLASHVKLLRRLRDNPLTSTARWNLISAAETHTCLIGEGEISKGLFLVDVGVLRKTYLVPARSPFLSNDSVRIWEARLPSSGQD
jgi:hypothetical protein